MVKMKLYAYKYTVYWYIPCEYLFEDDSFSCSWLQVKLIKKEFDVRCGEGNRGYYTVTRRYEFYVRVARTISHE